MEQVIGSESVILIEIFPLLDYNDENLLTGVTHTREGKFTLKITLVRNLVKLPKGKYLLSYIGTTEKILSRKILLYFSASLLSKGKCRTYWNNRKNTFHYVVSYPILVSHGQRYTYRVLQTIQMQPILLCVWAEPAVLGSTKTALKFKYEI